jgi:hypothetical protein
MVIFIKSLKALKKSTFCPVFIYKKIIVIIQKEKQIKVGCNGIKIVKIKKEESYFNTLKKYFYENKKNCNCISSNIFQLFFIRSK